LRIGHLNHQSVQVLSMKLSILYKYTIIYSQNILFGVCGRLIYETMVVTTELIWSRDVVIFPGGLPYLADEVPHLYDLIR
jgi:hypothetical protein